MTHGTQSTKVINKAATTLGRKRALPARAQSRACPLWAEALGATRENPRAWAPLAPSPAPAYSQLLKESPLPSAAPPCPAGRPTGGSAEGARPLPTFPTRPTPQMLAIRSLDPKQQDIPPTAKWLPSPAGGQAIPTRLLCPWPGWPQHEAGQGAGSGRGWGWARACGGQLCPRRSPDGRESCLSGVPQTPPQTTPRPAAPEQPGPPGTGRPDRGSGSATGRRRGGSTAWEDREGRLRPTTGPGRQRSACASEQLGETGKDAEDPHGPPPPGTRGRDPALRSHDGALELPPTHNTAPKLSG